MKRKGYAIVRITIQREVEVVLDDEEEIDTQQVVENAVAEKYGELNTENSEPDEVEILECDFAD